MRAERIGPDAADHLHAAAEAAGRARLVRAFAAGNRAEAAAVHGFARQRRTLDLRDEIHVQATDDDDLLHGVRS